MACVLSGAAVGVAVIRLFIIGAFHKISLAGDLAIAACRWERRYAACAVTIAALSGTVSAWCFFSRDPAIHMISAALVFGVAAGVVARQSVRPRLAKANLLLVVVPPACAAVVSLDITHVALSFAIVTTLFGGLDTISYNYVTTLEQLILKQRFANLAQRDPLTNLFNRHTLIETVEPAIERSHLTGEKIALHVLHLDHFKAANDRFGHPTGDELLKQVAQRLTELTRGDDIVVRLGGDEFVFVQRGVAKEQEAELLAQRILRSISRAYEIFGQDIRIGVSVGIAFAPTDGSSVSSLLAAADEALYRSKLSRNRFSFASHKQPLIQAVAS